MHRMGRIPTGERDAAVRGATDGSMGREPAAFVPRMNACRSILLVQSLDRAL